MKREDNAVADLMPEKARALISGRWKDVIRVVGADVIRDIVGDVMCGANLRDSTEMITRRKLATLNAAILVMFLRGESESEGFISRLPSVASEGLKSRLKKEDRNIRQWVLGLTDKATQNVLRDNVASIDKYREEYLRVCEEVVAACETDYGKLAGELRLGSLASTDVDWGFVVKLLQTVGAQTLAIRGSEKSTYGKLFERLVLGSLLTVLGFDLVNKNSISSPNRVFWLSSAGQKRESDATLLYEPGKGIRFDIGFIGRGNPEISLDKVSRFEREVSLGTAKWFMGTIILVDTIGKGSRIVELATAIQGTIIQMSMAYWPKQVAAELNKKLGFQHELVGMPDEEVQSYLKNRIAELEIERFLPGATSSLL